MAANIVLDAGRNPVETPAEGLIALVPSVGSKLTLLTAGDPDMTVAVGGWETTERFKQAPVKWWKALPGGALQLDLAIDIRSVPGVDDIERRIRALAAMGAPPPNHDEPPTIRLVGGHLPLATVGRWVMQGLSLGAQTVYDGVLVRQDVSVALERYGAVDPIAPVRPGRTRQTLTGRRRRVTLRSRQGDTLRAIALRQLGDAGRWTDIRKWNTKLKKTDPDAPLRTNTIVVLK